ncbi:hypothetical protein [Fodinicola feengrottensis]|uniref:hypothetical protein n=1 Tax=Fodinicola feengrottensis TaxID=435914 RepID=UPI0013D3B6FB
MITRPISPPPTAIAAISSPLPSGWAPPACGWPAPGWAGCIGIGCRLGGVPPWVGLSDGVPSAGAPASNGFAVTCWTLPVSAEYAWISPKP